MRPPANGENNVSERWPLALGLNLGLVKQLGLVICVINRNEGVKQRERRPLPNDAGREREVCIFLSSSSDVANRRLSIEEAVGQSSRLV